MRKSISAWIRSQMAYPCGRITIVPRIGPGSASVAFASTSWYQRGKSAVWDVSTPDTRTSLTVTGDAPTASQWVNETKGAVMKIFVAGATGVLGRALVPQLVSRGHEVVGMTRSASKQDLVRSLGARPVVADALDPDAVARAVASAEPQVIVHQLTALSGPTSMRDARRPDRSIAAT